MSVRHKSLRVAIALSTIIAISAAVFASSWDEALARLPLSLLKGPVTDGQAPDESVEPEKAATIGVCNTVGPIEVESSGGTTAPTAYATLESAFTNMRDGMHTGSINVEVCGDTVENVPAVLPASGTILTSYTDVTIRPVGGPRIIEGVTLNAIIRLDGADNITIDGRQGGVGDARDLTVRNNSPSGNTAAIWLSSVVVGNGASNNTIRNLELAAGAPQDASATNTFGIIMSGPSIGVTTNGVDNDNNSFIANRIIRTRYGIVTRGTAASNLNVNPIVTDNIIGPSAFGPDEIGKVGILMQADTGGVVSRNVIQFVGCLEPQACGGADRIGIAIGNESWSMAPPTITSNTYTVTKNLVHDIVEELTFSAIGINLATTGGGTSTNNVVANNFIYNVRANGITGEQAVGLGIAGGHTDRVVFNSISMIGDVDPGTAAPSTQAGSGIRIANQSGATHANLTLANNSVYMDLSSSSTAGVRYYAISGPSSTYSFGTGGENNNNYYINPANPQLQTGGLGTTSGNTLPTQFATLTNWQAAYNTPQDANSIQGDPLYVLPTGDLHINSASPNQGAGTAILGVTDDIDDHVRQTPPDIGADEVAPSNTAPTITAEAGVTRQAGSASSNSQIATVNDAEDVENTLTVTVDGEASSTVNGVTVSGISVDAGGLVTANVVAACGASNASFTLRVTDSGSLFNEATLNVTVTANTSPTISFNNASVAFGGSTSVNPAPGPADNGSVASIAVQSPGTYTGTISVDNVTGIVSISNAAPAGAHSITIRPTDNCGSTTDASFTLTVGLAVPLTVQFGATSFIDDESQTMSVLVTRTGDTTGVSTVDYATSNGTATAGVCGSGGDYVAASNTLQFNAGVTQQFIFIPLCADSATEATETFNIALSNPAGATLGSQSTATGNINDTATQFRDANAIDLVGPTANPYPAQITVAGGPANVGGVRVTLYDLLYTNPDDIDVLLVGPGGQQIILMADAGGANVVNSPTTLTFSDTAAQVLPDATLLGTGLYEPTSWGATKTDFPAPAPLGPYSEPGSTVGGTPSLFSVFGTTNSNGTWRLYVRSDAGGGFGELGASSGFVGGWGLELFAPTAANSTLSGRVMDSRGLGLSNVLVSIEGGALTLPISTRTSTFGNYSFDGLPTGHTYLVRVTSRRYTFDNATQVVTVNDNVTGVDFTATSSQ